MKNYVFFSFLVSVTILASCTSDSTSDLIDVLPITEQVKYTQNIKSIMENNCISCHGAILVNGAPMPLVTYEQVKDAYLNRGLLDRMQRQNGDGSLMPQGGPRLPQNVIDLVEKWNTDGLQE